MPSLGTSVAIYIENSAGIPTTAFLIFSTEQISVPIGYGGRLLTEPQIFFAVPMPPEGLTINWNIPNDPALTGLSIFGQVIEVDPGTLFGFSASRGLRATIGI